jgi:hypothetical protein
VPLLRISAATRRWGSIKLNETLTLAACSRLLGCLHDQRRDVLPAHHKKREARGRDRGLNSAPVSPALAAKGGLWPSLCFFLVMLGLQAACCRESCRLYQPKCE